jgi:hypothetical protein
LQWEQLDTWVSTYRGFLWLSPEVRRSVGITGKKAVKIVKGGLSHKTFRRWK